LTHRILVVLQTPRDEHSAVFITYRAAADALAVQGHPVTIVTPDDFPAVRRAGGRWTPLLFPLLVSRWLRSRRKENELVVFHSYSGWLTTASAGRRFPSVVAFHGLEPLYHAELCAESRPSWRYRALQELFMPLALRLACRRADRVICLNEAERAEIARRGWASHERVSTFAHGVPEQFFAVAREPRPVSTLLFVGQWLPMKGVAYLSAAFNELAARNPHVRLVCAGTLADAATVASSFDPGVRARVTVLPRVNRNALTECYRQADLFVFPSLYEGFGLALLEAMATGLPIVTTPVGIAGDVLRHEASALLVAKRDSRALTVAVERLMTDDRLRVRLGEGARHAALDYRESDKVADLARLLVDVANGAPAGAGGAAVP
jgi:glycosyltransferase involved in cell wall biosynthesis